MTEDDLQRSRELFRNAGFSIGDSWYDEQAFGSWCVEVSKQGMPKQRVVWDGKDGWLVVSAFASSDSWMDKWTARKKSDQSPEAALAQLEVPVTREWEEGIERQRAEYWRRVQLEQALSQAARLWDEGCYTDYVRELSPHRDQLSPAQLKRFDIAQNRANDS